MGLAPNSQPGFVHTVSTFNMCLDNYYFVTNLGSIPVVNEFNFNEYEIVFVGGSINLTVEYSPNVLTFKWYRFHATLPPGDRSSIINYSVKGKNYSSLILSNMTDDDWGLYFFTVTSYCGLTTSVNVTVDVRSGNVY